MEAIIAYSGNFVYVSRKSDGLDLSGLMGSSSTFLRFISKRNLKFDKHGYAFIVSVLNGEVFN